MALRPLALPLTRRLALAAFLAATAPLFTPAALAAAPMAKTQAPGFYRMVLGAYEITALSDGTVDLPVEALLHSEAHDIPRQLKARALPSPLETSVNAYLINTGDRLVLVDTGTGALMGPRLGRVEANLRAAGYLPEQVDDILLTHAHVDHVGGLVREGRMVFPQATVHIEQAEAAYWMSPERMAQAQPAERGFFEGAIASLAPYAQAGRLKPFAPGATLMPGIQALTAHGHTVGHTVYGIESQGQRLLLIGDLVHVGALQLDDPRITIAFDTDEKAARATRLKFFTEAARSRALIGASHLSFPGIGRLGQAGRGFRWMPVDYSTRMP